MLLLYVVSIVFFLSIDIYAIHYYSIENNCYFICDYKSMKDAIDLYLKFFENNPSGTQPITLYR